MRASRAFPRCDHHPSTLPGSRTDAASFQFGGRDKLNGETALFQTPRSTRSYACFLNLLRLLKWMQRMKKPKMCSAT